MNILEQIVNTKQREVADQKSSIPLKKLKESFKNFKAEKRSLVHKMNQKSTFHFICEVKKASPTAGQINAQVNPQTQAIAYQNGGASAISVLTDYEFFKGSPKDLEQVRDAVVVPVLRKDFIIDEYQIWQSALLKADLILLIVKILEREQLQRFLDLARQLSLEVLVELYDEADLKKLPENIEDFPVILGVNNRNLENFSIDLNHSIEMVTHLPKNVPLISESGIKSAEDCLFLKAHGFQGALIGETLMRQENPQEFLKKLTEATNHVYAS